MNWLNQLSFRTQMAIPNIVILIFFLIILTFIYRTFDYQFRINQQIQEEIQPVLNNFDDGYRDMYQMIAAAQAVMLSGDDGDIFNKQKQEYEDNAPKVLPRITSAQRLIDQNIIPSTLNKELTELTTALSKWRKHFDQVFISPENANAYIKKHQPQMDALFSIVRKRLKVIREAVEVKQKALLHQEKQAVNDAYFVMTIGVIVSILASVILGFIFTRVMLSQLNKLKSAMLKIAAGEGDLRQRISIESTDEIGELGTIFNQFADKIQHLVKEVITGANVLKNTIGRIDDGTKNIAQRTKETSTENTSIATSVHELSATSDQVKCDADEAANASNLALSDAVKVKRSLDSTVHSIDALGKDIQQASEVISELETEVGNIVSILDVIRGIADQTNLLALNAAIEAARAGEQGRGFAVVADEVRSLASKTQDSTGEIQTMIEKLQQGTKSAVEVMLQSNQTSQSTTEQAIKANDSLSAITDAINVITQMNNQIAQASSEQSQVSESINITIQALAEKGTDLVKKVSRASNECHSLREESEKLEYLVQQFKV
jgi:methyl-accepting chemotaxis protein